MTFTVDRRRAFAVDESLRAVNDQAFSAENGFFCSALHVFFGVHFDEFQPAIRLRASPLFILVPPSISESGHKMVFMINHALTHRFVRMKVGDIRKFVKQI